MPNKPTKTLSKEKGKKAKGASSPSLGQFVIVNLYDHRYWNVFLDGELDMSPCKCPIMAEISDTFEIDEWEEKTGLKKKHFRYTVIDLADHFSRGAAMDPNYDANDYDGDYAKIMALGIVPKHRDLKLKELSAFYD